MVENDDVTYAKVNFSQSGSRKKNQSGINEREDVIYSNVNHLREGGSAPDVSSPEVRSKPNDPLPTPRSEVKTNKRTCHRSTMVLLVLSILLLVMTICLGVMVVLKADLEAALRENEKNLTDHFSQLKSLMKDKDNLTNHLETLAVNHSKEKIDLKNQLQGKNNETTKLKSQNEALALKNVDLMKNLSELQRKNADLESQLSASQESCASGWKPFNGKCYYFSTDVKNWADSRDACVTMGGHLVIIESAEELDFLKGVILSIKILSMSYWIGLTDSVTEGDWRWVDDTAFRSDSSFWERKEPDNWTKNNAHPEGEDCAHMSGLNGGHFMDAFCSDSKQRICESSLQCSKGG
ncbi:asialoglycoprotein receptor 2-like [Sardina pilchardus]|uniref:asialoglycoprotein receptor 2-like n=1 Tax=Sardina pilchardus TaxID=27697 RepID=UPI002E1388EC